MITVEQACPQINLPSDRPSGSLITTLQQGVFYSLKKLWMSKRRNLIAGEQSVCMRYVAVSVFRIVQIFQPFLQLIVTPYLHRSHFGKQGSQRISVSSRKFQNLRSCQCIAQYIENNLIIHRTARYDSRSFLGVFTLRTMLGRHGRSCYFPSIFRMRNHISQEEIGGSFHCRIRFSQEIFIAGIQIMLP